MTLAKAAVPFPLIPYLQIDFSEIPILIAFFLFGPVAATVSTVIQWLFLNVQGSDAPLGPLIKFIAIMSMLGGFTLGNAIYRYFKPNRAHPSIALLMMLSGGVLLRVISMTIVNYAVLIYMGPVFFGADYLSYAKFTLEQTTGWRFTNDFMVLAYALFFTTIYNVINLIVAADPAVLIISPVTRSFKHITSVDAWLVRSTRS